MEKEGEFIKLTVKPLEIKNDLQTIETLLKRAAHEKTEKKREVIRSLNRQLINNFCKADRKFAKEVKKVMNMTWHDPFLEETYIKVITDLANKCLENKNNITQFKNFIIEKQALLEPKNINLINSLVLSNTTSEEIAISQKLLREMLYEGIFASAMRKLQTPKLIYLSKTTLY